MNAPELLRQAIEISEAILADVRAGEIESATARLEARGALLERFAATKDETDATQRALVTRMRELEIEIERALHAGREALLRNAGELRESGGAPYAERDPERESVLLDQRV